MCILIDLIANWLFDCAVEIICEIVESIGEE